MSKLNCWLSYQISNISASCCPLFQQRPCHCDTPTWTDKRYLRNFLNHKTIISHNFNYKNQKVTRQGPFFSFYSRKIHSKSFLTLITENNWMFKLKEKLLWKGPTILTLRNYNYLILTCASGLSANSVVNFTIYSHNT